MTKTIITIIVVLGVLVLGYYAVQDYREKRSALISGEFQKNVLDVVREGSEKQNYEKYKDIVNPSGYVNTEGITIGELIGKKVVLVDFMTYSCINCIRTFPYLVEWYDKYKDDGLEIVGIHTPEFEFEKDINNVREAMQKHSITFPIVLDNDYGTWRAYSNRYWPRKYLIDIEGNIVYDHIGEGAYGATEQKIQELLKERMEKLGMRDGLDEELSTSEGKEVVRRGSVGSPETYFGLLRQGYESYGGHRNVPNGSVKTFAAPTDIALNTLYLVGDWIVTDEYAQAVSEGAKIVYRYRASNVFLVSTANDGEVRAQIVRDGEVVGDEAGRHVQNGIVTVTEEDLYRLIEDKRGPGEHTIEIIAEPGFRAFAFTFG